MTQFYGTLTPEKTEREEKNMQLVRKGAGEMRRFPENLQGNAWYFWKMTVFCL